MVKPKPKASSTPKIIGISRRRPIGDVNNDSVQSPIFTYKYKSESPEKNRYTESNSQDSDDYFDSNDETEMSIEEMTTNTVFCNCLNSSCLLIVSAILILVCILHAYSEENNHISLQTLAKDYPSQVEDFWIYIDTGIRDIVQLEQPKTFVFLYNDESQETLEHIVNQIAEYATCILSNCTARPVILEASDLSSADILNDYGEVITRNRAKLEESGVMIVKNLEKIPGVAAQAFHSFCDEYYPVVKKALFIFTMKVDKFYDNNMKFIENDLHNRWSDIKDDTFSALFTRIANVVLPIIAENEIK